MNDPHVLLIHTKKIKSKQDKRKSKKGKARKKFDVGGITGKYGKRKKEEIEGRKMFGKFWTPNQNTFSKATKGRKKRDDSIFEDPTKYLKVKALYIPVETLRKDPSKKINLFKNFYDYEKPIDFLDDADDDEEDREEKKLEDDEKWVLRNYIKLLRNVPVKDDDEWRCPGCGEPIPDTAQECGKFYCENEVIVDKIKDIIKENNINVRNYSSVGDAFDALKGYM